MADFLHIVKSLLLLATPCLWLYGVSGEIVVRQYHRKYPAPQNWKSYKKMFSDSTYPVHQEFRETVLGFGGFLLLLVLLIIVNIFDPA